MKIIKISKIETFPYKGKVFDLTVEKDHSYNINGIAVHNSACTTSVLTGHHVSLEYSLKIIKGIKDIGKSQDGKYISFDDWIKTNGYTKTKVIADGGINSIDKAIKALALGADYVMLGKMLAQCYESCGDKTWKRFIGFKNGKPYLYRKTNYYGQSSERGQIDRFGYVKSSPEGKEYLIPVNDTISSFVDKFEAALRSSMSYAGAKTLDEFIGKVDYKYQTESEFRAYNK